MRIIIDQAKLKEGGYDENGFSLCECGRHHYPSKKMLADFLSPLRLNGKPVADIWSSTDLNTAETTIHLEIKYKALKKK